jgi:hypothetical protein
VLRVEGCFSPDQVESLFIANLNSFVKIRLQTRAIFEMALNFLPLLSNSVKPALRSRLGLIVPFEQMP